MGQETRYRVAGVIAVAGLLVGGAAGIITFIRPPTIQHFVQNPLGSFAVLALAVVTAGCLALWARKPGEPDRLPFVVAVLGSAALVTAAFVLGLLFGWWKGPIFDAPLLPLTLLAGLKASLLLTLYLVLYRWLARRRLWLARLIYLLLVIAQSFGTIRGDEMVIAQGAMAFGGGYTVWHDVVLATIFLLLPLFVYELLLWRHRASGQVRMAQQLRQQGVK